MQHRLWIFDLDNTLHDATPHIFPRINQSMTDYIGQHLGLDPSQATALRQRYWHRYGATLLGLIRHHGTDPNHFLHATHIFPDLAEVVVFDKKIRQALQRLPGRKIIFSNAPRHYTDAILAHTGLARIFDAIYAVEQVRYRPKPSLAGFLQILQREQIPPSQAIMVEDSLDNLAAAKRLGMKTVWITKTTRRPSWLDLTLASVADLPRNLQRIAPI